MPQNAELRRELQRMQGWREAALQLEQKNARLLALNNVRLSPRLTFVTGEIMADAGSPFRRSATVNVGRIDGVTDGSAAVDGLGLVGRIAGVGERSARIIFLNDASSRVPAVVRPSGQRAIVAGDNGPAPTLEFVEQADELRPGDRVVSSGDGGLYPPDILIGQVVGRPGRPAAGAAGRRLPAARLRPGGAQGAGGAARRPGPDDRAGGGGRSRQRRAAAGGRGMNRPRGLPPWAENALLIGLGVVAVQAPLVPLDLAGRLVPPDLLYGLVVAWVIRRPAATPLWIVVALGLFADVMLSRPLGLGALGLVLATEAFRVRAGRFSGVPFPVEWLAATGASRRCWPGCRSRSSWSSPQPPAIGTLVRHLVATALAYPIVVFGLTWCLGLRAARSSQRYDRSGGAAAVKRDPKAPAPRITRRGLVLLGMQAGVVGVLGWRMRDLQIVQNERYRLLAEENRVNLRLIPPARGMIFDREGRLLAGNRQNYRIVMVREQAREPEMVLERLASIVPLADADRERALKEMAARSAFVPVVVAEHLTWDDVVRVSANAPVLPGVIPEVGLSRYYPDGPSTSHVIGYVGPVSESDLAKIEDPDPLLQIPRFQIGKTGIEAQARAGAARRGGDAEDRGERRRAGDARARARRGDGGQGPAAHAGPEFAGLRDGAHGRRERGGGGDRRDQRRHRGAGLGAGVRAEQLRLRDLVDGVGRAAQ